MNSPEYVRSAHWWVRRNSDGTLYVLTTGDSLNPASARALAAAILEMAEIQGTVRGTITEPQELQNA